jgi:glycosyltransferase involved in cell wall biosynthesis
MRSRRKLRAQGGVSVAIMSSQPSEPPPKVSVIVASKVGAPFIDRCLESLRVQASALDAEVIVVVDKAGYAAELEATFPWARVIHGAGIAKVPALRRRGLEEATGELVAIIEEHCSAKADWLEQAMRAHESGEFAAVGGPIVDDDYRRLRDWVVYFLEYNSALPPAPRGETVELNDANVLYRRQALLDHLDLLDEGYWSMTLNPALHAEGNKLQSVPEMVVYHHGPFDFGYYLHQRFLFSRAFAGVRAQAEPASRRVAYLIGAPLIPLMLLGRMTSRVFQKRRRVGRFVQSLPLIVPALVVMVAGEWVGCLLGPGDALNRVE